MVISFLSLYERTGWGHDLVARNDTNEGFEAVSLSICLIVVRQGGASFGEDGGSLT
jgi:hypothetical protein